MSQKIYCAQLARYLRFKYANNADQIQRMTPLLDVLGVNNRGFCFGFITALALRDQKDELDDWNSIYNAVMNWCGAELELENVVYLPNSNAKITLRNIFESFAFNVLEYHLDNNIPLLKDCIPTGVNQNTVLLNNGALSLYSSVSNKNKNITQNTRIACNFTKSQLLNIITENLLKNIVYVYKLGHVVYITYKNNQWLIYDSNYLLDPLNKDSFGNALIYKLLSTKELLVEEIIRLLGNSLAFEVATFDENPQIDLPSFNTLNENRFADAISNLGLHTILRFTPKNLLSVKINKNELEQFYQVYAAELNKQIPMGWTAFNLMAFYATDYLPVFFDLGKKYNVLFKAISVGLNIMNDRKQSPLQAMLGLRPEFCLSLAEDAEWQPVILENTIEVLNNAGEAYLDVILKKIPKYLSLLIQHSLKSGYQTKVLELFSLFSGWLSKNNTAPDARKLFYLSNHHAGLLSELIKCGRFSTDLSKAIYYGMVETDEFSRTPLHILANNSVLSSFWADLFEEATKQHYVMQTLIDLAAIQDQNDATFLHMLVIELPLVFDALLMLADKNLELASAILSVCLLQDKYKETIFHQMSGYPLAIVERFINLILKQPDNYNDRVFAFLLTSVNVNGVTGFDMIVTKFPEFLPLLMQRAKHSSCIAAALAKVITSQFCTNYNGLQNLAIYAPYHLIQILQLINAKCFSGSVHIHLALNQVAVIDDIEVNGIDVITKFCPQHLNAVNILIRAPIRASHHQSIFSNKPAGTSQENSKKRSNENSNHLLPPAKRYLRTSTHQ